MNSSFIGILGLGVNSTVLLYKKLNNAFKEKYGEGHTCPIKLVNANFYPVNKHLPNELQQAGSHLKPYLDELNEMQPSRVIIPNNTIHEVIDALGFEFSMPFGHIGKLINKFLSDNEEVTILGTYHTMHSDYWNKFVPNHCTRRYVAKNLALKLEKLRKIYIDGVDESLAKECWSELLDSDHKNMIITCTELSIAFQNFTSTRFTDTMDLQVAFCLK